MKRLHALLGLSLVMSAHMYCMDGAGSSAQHSLRVTTLKEVMNRSVHASEITQRFLVAVSQKLDARLDFLVVLCGPRNELKVETAQCVYRQFLVKQKDEAVAFTSQIIGVDSALAPEEKARLLFAAKDEAEKSLLVDFTIMSQLISWGVPQLVGHRDGLLRLQNEFTKEGATETEGMEILRALYGQ